MATAKRPEKYQSPFRKAVRALDKKSPEELIQLLVAAGLMEQDEADQAKLRYRQKHGAGDSEAARGVKKGRQADGER